MLYETVIKSTSVKPLALFLTCLLSTFLMQAQTPVGKWKFFSGYTETADGKKMDLLKDSPRDYACAAAVVWNFTSNGKITFENDKCSADIEVPLRFGTRWKMEGKNKITVRFDELDETDSHTYDFEIKGSKMRWSMTFPDEPGTNSSKHIRLLVLEYIKA